jgi:hypothetical protein
MYSRKESSQIKQEFWTTYGRYMRPIMSSSGMKVNWVSYKTGVKHLRFVTDVDGHVAKIGIELSHADKEMQLLFMEQFVQMKIFLNSTIGEEWTWDTEASDSLGRPVCLIYISLDNVNVFDKECWPELIQFFKPRMIALDEFWSMAFETFNDLQT